MAKNVTRYIKREAERELWARSAGRCQFDGCNRLLFKSPVTQEQVNISEKAHIYSFSENGPRGWGHFASNRAAINDLSNLMLVCHDCHKKIDQDVNGERYSAEVLIGWKEEHERRIAIVTSVDPSKRSHVVLYGANIGDEASKLQPEAAKDALFPDWYPADERVIQLSMNWEGKDDDSNYWETESKNLKLRFYRQIKPALEEANPYHFSIFALAPIPLMVLFGALLTDKVPAEVYQLHREPCPSWKWSKEPVELSFKVRAPSTFEGQPALVFSLSDSIDYSRIHAVLGQDVSIWEFTIENPNNDFLKSREQLSRYRSEVRQLMVNIGKAHGKQVPIKIFPAIPVACAVELGRVRMPKSDNPWIIYDQNHKHKKFIQTITIGGIHD